MSAILVLLASLLTHSVRADSAEVWQAASPGIARARVLLLRADDAPRSDFTLRVERALNRSLSELDFSVSGSALPFHDAQLAAGCAGSVRDCGSQVAAALESEQLLVSSIEEKSAGRYATLTLQRFEAHAPVRAGTAQLPREPSEELALTVYALVESIFSDRVKQRGVAAPRSAGASTQDVPAAAASARETQSFEAGDSGATPRQANASDTGDRSQRRALLAVGWPSLTLGAGLLVGGLVANLASQREHRADLAISDPSTRGEVDAKWDHHENAEQKAEAARVLWGVGGALAAAGIFVLLWERFAPLSDRKLQKSSSAATRHLSAQRISAGPLPRGFSLSWSAPL